MGQVWDGRKFVHGTLRYIVKTLWKSSSQELNDRWPWNLVYSIENWALSSLFKWWPLVDPDLFYVMIKFGHLGLLVEKRPNSGFEAHLSFWLTGKLIAWVDSVVDVCSLSSINIFKHLLLWNHRSNWSQISFGASLGWTGGKNLGHLTKYFRICIYL